MPMFTKRSSHEAGLFINVWRHKVALKFRELLPWLRAKNHERSKGKGQGITEKWRHSHKIKI